METMLNPCWFSSLSSGHTSFPPFPHHKSSVSLRTPWAVPPAFLTWCLDASIVFNVYLINASQLSKFNHTKRFSLFYCVN